jgi:hypothetical protein
MSLEQISLIAQIASAVAVIASLIFVGWQVKQATQAVRNSSSQAHSANYTEIVKCLIGNGDFARIWLCALLDPDAPSDVDWVRFVGYASTLFRFYESSRVQWLHGQLDEEHWQTIERQVRTLTTQPGIQAWWRLRGHWHSESFRAWFESLPTTDVASLYGRKGVTGSQSKDSP